MNQPQELQLLPEVWEAFATDIENYTNKFLSLSKASTESTIAMCEVLHEAKSVLNKEDRSWETPFDEVCRRIGYPRSKSGLAPAIKKYLRIGACADRFKPYLDKLPNSWTTLYEITQLEPDKFNELIEAGEITAQLTGPGLKRLIDGKDVDKETSPKITLVFPDDVAAETVSMLCKELEALRINSEFSIQLNPTALKLQPNDGHSYG